MMPDARAPARPPLGALLATCQGHTERVRGVAWAPDSARLASAGNDKTVLLWDAAGGRLLRLLERQAWPVLGVAWAPDGTRLASASSAACRPPCWARQRKCSSVAP